MSCFSSTFKIPIWAKPRAAPPPSANATLGLLELCVIIFPFSESQRSFDLECVNKFSGIPLKNQSVFGEARKKAKYYLVLQIILLIFSVLIIFLGSNDRYFLKQSHAFPK
jgi:uncharacterized membrane protein